MAADADEKRIEYLEQALRELIEFAERALHPKVEANDEMIARLQKEADE